MTSVSAGHIILSPTQPVGSGRPQWESNPGPPHQESRALPTGATAPPCYDRITSQATCISIAEREPKQLGGSLLISDHLNNYYKNTE